MTVVRASYSYPRQRHRRTILFFIVSLSFLASLLHFFVHSRLQSYFLASSPTDGVLFHRPTIPMSWSELSKLPEIPMIVVAPTFYASVNEIRYELGVAACREASKYRIPLILVDASPSEDVRLGLQEAGYNKNNGKNYVQVFKQTAVGKKGTALREAIQLAFDQLKSDSIQESKAVIAFQELEKVDMFRHWRDLYNHMQDTGSGVTVVGRKDASFKKYYPIEQYHSENFGNMFFNAAGRTIGLPPVDWCSGPAAFKRSFVDHWLNYPGELWDVQLVPIVRAYRDGAKVTAFDVDYRHPATMKQQEEGKVEWNEKRLFQINMLKDTLVKEIMRA